MKKLGLAILAFGVVFTGHAEELGLEDGESTQKFETVENKAFKPGEKLVYRLFLLSRDHN